jgi:uncharacterized protein Smg (DUF494 family)
MTFVTRPPLPADTTLPPPPPQKAARKQELQAAHDALCDTLYKAGKDRQEAAVKRWLEAIMRGRKDKAASWVNGAKGAPMRIYITESSAVD